MPQDPLKLGFSPCPNDTFIFDALVHDRIDTEGLRFAPVLADVEALNLKAQRGELDITKLSFSAFGSLTAVYDLLHAGSALGRGVGPLLVRKAAKASEELTVRTVAIPGHYTTANYLLGLAYPDIRDKTEIVFDRIEDAVLGGLYDAGLLIHENRFTYQDRGLELIRDLGTFWEDTTGFPIPLGGIVVRKSMAKEMQRRIDRVLRRSVEYALAHPEASEAYVRTHAREMDPEVVQKHIALYVTDFTKDLGDEGLAAVKHFITDGRAKGLLPPGGDDYIV